MSQVGRYSRRLTGGNPGYPKGVLNGRVPLSRLRLCVSQPQLGSGPGRYLYPPAALGLDAMAAAAREDGIALRVLGGYRTYERQVELREQWARQGKASFAAVPGRSNHGWATAIDIDRHAADTRGIVPWLQRNAACFGWDHPLWAGDGRGVEEPWHWQWIRGFVMAEQEQEFPVAVTVAGAEGSIEGGDGWCWVRPLVKQLGAEVKADAKQATITRGERTVTLTGDLYRFENGKGYVRLDSLEKIGVRAGFGRALLLEVD